MHAATVSAAVHKSKRVSVRADELMMAEVAMSTADLPCTTRAWCRMLRPMAASRSLQLP